MTSTNTIAEAKRLLLDKYLQSAPGTNGDGTDPIIRRSRTDPAPLSLAQQQVWVHSQVAPDLPIYNEPFTVHRHGPLDIHCFERALTEIIRRHEAWRTVFPLVEGHPSQVVKAPFQVKLPLTDLRGLPAAQREQEALRLAAEDAQLPFDLSQGPLLRMKLVHLEENEYRLYMTLHQIILDGVTAYQVFLPELVSLYEAFSAGKPSPLPELSIQGSDYACWEREWLPSQKLTPHMAYWRRQLAGEIPVLNLPTDRPRPATQSFCGAMYPLSLPPALVEEVRSMSQHQSATLFMAMVAAFYVVLRRYTGQDDIILGTLTTSRRRPEVEKLLGYFVNPVVLRVNLSGNPSFRQLLARVRDVVLEAISHDEVPFEYLVKDLHPSRDVSRNPLFQVMISLEPPMPALEGWSMTQFDVASGASKFDLYLDLDDRENGIIGPITYNPDLFDRETIGRLVEHWQTVLQAAAADPGRPIAELPILTKPEREHLLQSGNGMRTQYTAFTMTQLFEEQVARTPDALAVQDDNSQLTYRELNSRANQLARHLQTLGVESEELVGICTDRSLDMLIAPLAVLKAGGAYVPLDASYPKERLAQMLRDSGARVLLTQQALLGKLPDGAPQLVFVDEGERVRSEQDDDNLASRVKPEALAYVIYTSGSTGIPKGVEVAHRSLANLLMSMRDRPGITERDTFLSVTTLSFDIAALELFLPLICGARMVIASSATAQNGQLLLQRLKSCAATMMQGTPATWRMLVDAGWQGDPQIKVLCGGEALSRDLADDLLKRSSSVWNLYGPTETTIWSAASQLQIGEAPVDIGEPIANTTLHVLDASGELLPIGVPGELHIGGSGLARGYRNLPELTREKFSADRLSSETGARLYKTGDLVRRISGDRLQFLGRLDDQVKVRGFRIELGEVGTALRRHPAIREAAVDAQTDSVGEKHLVAYLVPRSLPAPAVDDLRAFLEDKLPAYMMPAKFVFLNALPLTPNGKLDRRALPFPSTIAKSVPAFVSPQNPTEKKLCDVWEAVLDVRPIGITQNFFDLGGHSLLVARMIARIEGVFGRRFSLVDVFQAPTIEQMAKLLTRSIDPVPSGIVEIQPRGTKPPLLWVRGGPLLLPLTQRLGTDQPVLGIYLTTQEAAELPQPCTVEQIAGLFVRKIKKLQPVGPYYLGGLCIDGVLAYEMARQLREQHEEIALLAMVDAHNPLFYNDFSEEGRFLIMRRRVAYHLGKIAKLKWKNLGAYVSERWDGVNRRMDRLKWEIAYHLHRNQSQGGIVDLDYIVHPAANFYQPGFYAGPVSFFQSTDWPRSKYWDFQLGWRNLVRGSLNVYRIPGGHKSTFYEANVEVLASRLKQCLERAQMRSTAGTGLAVSSPEALPQRGSAASIAQPSPAIRVATFDDYQGISALQARYFPETKSFAEWRRLWSENPVYQQLPEWPIGWIVENEEGEIVGYLGNIPLTFEFAGRQLLATTCYALVVDGQYRNYSLPLLSRFFGQNKVDLIVDTTVNANACRSHEVFRARRVPMGVWNESVFWITNHRGFLASWLLAKGIPLATTMSYPFSLGVRVKEMIWNREVRGHRNSIVVRPSDTFDDRFETFWQELRRTQSHLLLATRSAEVLCWHFKHSLAEGRAWVGTVCAGSQILAYAIFHRQDNPTYGLKRMRLVDFQSLNGENESLAPLVRWGLEQCRMQGIHMLETIGLSPEKQQILDQLGPYKRELPSWLYFYKANDPTLAAKLEAANVWNPSWFDGDASL